ncbi:glycoside hydrolase family 30 beta sandwich domain-containing protein [Elusimicrobiota bacterium]
MKKSQIMAIGLAVMLTTPTFAAENKDYGKARGTFDAAQKSVYRASALCPDTDCAADRPVKAAASGKAKSTQWRAREFLLKNEAVDIGNRLKITAREHQPIIGIGYGTHFWAEVIPRLPPSIYRYMLEDSNTQVIRLKLNEKVESYKGNFIFENDPYVNFAIEAKARNKRIKFLAAGVKHPQWLLEEVLRNIERKNGEQGPIMEGEWKTPESRSRETFINEYSRHILEHFKYYRSIGIEIWGYSQIEPNVSRIALPEYIKHTNCEKANKVYLTPELHMQLFIKLRSRLDNNGFSAVKLVFPTASSINKTLDYLDTAVDAYGKEKVRKTIDHISTNNFSVSPKKMRLWRKLENYVESNFPSKKIIGNAIGDLSRDGLKPGMESGLDLFEYFYQPMENNVSLWNYVFGLKPDTGASGLIGFNKEGTDFGLTDRYRVFSLIAGLVPQRSTRLGISMHMHDRNIKALAFKTKDNDISALIMNRSEEVKHITLNLGRHPDVKSLASITVTGDSVRVKNLGYNKNLLIKLPAMSVTGVTSLQVK